MRRTSARLTMAGAWLLLAGAPLLAQQQGPAGKAPPGRPHGAGMPMMDCPMMSASMQGPAAALRAGGALKLSADQRTRLQAAQRRIDASAPSSMDSMRLIHAQLMALAQQPSLDEARTRTAFDRMGRVHTELGLGMLRASHEVRGILTGAQRDSLAAFAKRQMSRPGAMPMQGMPMGAMPMCPMMGMGTAPHG